jgi:hypothetical protein
MREFPKAIKRKLNELCGLAHEEALRRALEPLGRDFELWRERQLDSGTLAIRIHEFDHGPARELFNYYNRAWPEMVVAAAIVDGLLDRRQIPPEVLEAIGDMIGMIERSRKRAGEDPGSRLSAAL